MNEFHFELSGFPALVIIALCFYLFVYLPIKLVVAGIARAKRKADRLRLLSQRTIIAEYDPPANLSPAEIGFLHDTKLTAAEVYGTIVSLEQQGLVTIAEEQNHLQIVDVKPAPPDCKEFEKHILLVLAQHRGQPINRKLLTSTVRSANQIIKKQLQDQGYLASPLEGLKQSLFALIIIVTTLIMLTVALFRPNSLSEIGAFAFFVIILWPIYLVVSVFLYATFKKIAGESWLATPKLKRIWSGIEGYRQFIEIVELDNLQFDSQNVKGTTKNETLPYAIAFEFNTGWRKRL